MSRVAAPDLISGGRHLQDLSVADPLRKQVTCGKQMRFKVLTPSKGKKERLKVMPTPVHRKEIFAGTSLRVTDKVHPKLPFKGISGETKLLPG